MKFLQVILLLFLLSIISFYFGFRLSRFPTVRWLYSNLAPTPTLTLEETEQKKREEFIQITLASMTLEEIVGQMFIWGVDEPSLSAQTANILHETNAGGVILTGKPTFQQLNKLTHDIQKLKKKVPFFIAIDGEIGLINTKITGYNSNVSNLEDLSNNEICTKVEDISNFLYDNGVNVNFGIIADIGWGNYSFIKPRTYGDSPEKVKEKVKTAIECSENILTTVKHFPGHGRTKDDTHNTIPTISISPDEWSNTDKVPFQEAINDQIDFVMMGHLLYSKFASDPASLSSAHHNIIREMGFNGIIITDDMGMLETAPNFDSLHALDQAVLANNDILLYVNHHLVPQEIVGYVVEKVKNKTIPLRRINESVKRILSAKYNFTSRIEEFTD